MIRFGMIGLCRLMRLSLWVGFRVCRLFLISLMLLCLVMLLFSLMLMRLYVPVMMWYGCGWLGVLVSVYFIWLMWLLNGLYTRVIGLDLAD